MRKSWIGRKSSNFDQQSEFITLPTTSELLPLKNDLKALREKRESNSTSIPQAVDRVLLELNKQSLQKLCLLQYYLLGQPTQREVPSRLTMLDFEIGQGLALLEQKPKKDEYSNPAVFKTRSLDIGPLADNLIYLRLRYLDELCEKSDIESEATFDVLHLDFQARLQTLAIRNWATPVRMKDISVRLFKVFDRELKERYELDTKQIAGILEAIEQEVQRAFLNHRNKISSIVNASSKRIALRNYENFFIDDRWEEIRSTCKTISSVEETITLLYMETDAFVHDIYKVDLSKVGQSLKVSPTSIKRLLDLLSCELGDRSETSGERLLLSNPIWRKPFIRESGVFFIPGLHLLSAFVFEILEEVVRSIDEEHLNRIKIRRPSFLEESIVKACEIRFGAKNVHKNVTRSTPGETDTLIVLENTAIVIEAKSARLPDSAKRGGRSLTQAISRNIGKALIQISEVEHLLMSEDSGNKLVSTKGDTIEFNAGSSARFIKLVVMLDPFFSFIADKIIRSNSKLRSLLIMGLADFELILERLRSPAEVVSYLVKRLDVQREHQLYTGDELDFLGSHLATGLEFPETNRNEILALTGCNRFVIDPQCPNAGGFVAELAMLDWWLDCIREVEKRPDLIPFELTVFMWSLSFSDQRKIEELRIAIFDEIVRNRNAEQIIRTLTFRWSNSAVDINLIGVNQYQKEQNEALRKNALPWSPQGEGTKHLSFVFDQTRRIYPFDDLIHG